jgi:hypothetical protein
MDRIGWNRFAEVCKEEFGACSFQQELIDACGKMEDLAWATFYHTRSNSISWLSSEVLALGEKRPADLIREGKADEVRVCLWRMP